MLYRNFFKRIIDLFFGVTGFILLSPIILIVIIILFVINNKKVFFLQARPGLNGKIFKIIKFKTMNDRVDKDGNLLPDSERLTAIGRLIRKTSLDEAPQLLNVIKGDMSLVGPRPLLIEYLSLYNASQQRRHNVRPGITGWAQVNGRNAITWDEKFKYDIWYVDHQTFLLDVKIMWMTFEKIFKSEGINQQGHVTMEKFKGNK
ncbi:MAG: sugar transferase [Mucilaginibacter sp.]